MNKITNDKEAFLLVQKGLIEQNNKCKNYQDECAYRGHHDETVDNVKKMLEKEGLEEDNEDYTMYFEEALYSIPFEKKCAAGFLVLDKFYEFNMEGNQVYFESGDAWFSIEKSNPVWKMTKNSYNLIRELQTIHDNYAISEWESLLLDLSQKFDSYGNYNGNQVL